MVETMRADAIMTRLYFKDGTGSMSILPVLRLTLPNGRIYRFQWHRYCGPLFLRRDGEPLARHPSERNPMWHSFQRWIEQGGWVDDEGNCLIEGTMTL